MLQQELGCIGVTMPAGLQHNTATSYNGASPLVVSCMFSRLLSFCVKVASLNLENPEIKIWVEFLRFCETRKF